MKKGEKHKYLRMKKHTLISLCFLLAVAAQAGTLPQGRWTVTQVTVEKNTGGNIETTVYNSAAELQGFFIPCIQEMEINEQTITVRYPSGREETAVYTTEGDLLIIHIPVGADTYHYSTSGENLILTATYNYVNNNLKEKTSTPITEQRIITLKK